MATEKIKVIKVDTKPAEESLQDLRKELKETRNVMLNAEEGTEEYNQALVKAANIQHRLKEQMEEINANAMDFGQIAGNVVKATGGMVAGFQAAQATMNLFGVENEDVLKSLEKMQNLMAITQAIPAIDDGIKGFKRLGLAIKGATAGMSGFKKALIATGLGALVVVLGSIIANWDEFTKSIGLSEKAMNKLKDVVNGVMGVLKSSLKGLTQAITKIITGDFKGAWESIKGGFDVVSNYNDAVSAGIEERQKEAAKKSAEEWSKYVEKRRKQLEEEAQLEEAKNKDGWKTTAEGKKYYDNYYNQLLSLYKKDSSEYNKVLISKLNYEKEYNKANTKEVEASYKIRLEQISNEERQAKLSLLAQGLSYKEYVKQKEDLEKDFTKKRIEALQNILTTSKNLTKEEIASLQEQLIKLQDSLYKKPEKEEKNDVKTKGEEIATSLYGLRDALADVATDNAWGVIFNNIGSMAGKFADLAKDIKENGKDSWSSYAQMAGLALNSVGTILSQLSNQEDKDTKEGFERSKKMQIAASVMNMLGGMISAWVSAMNPANAWMTLPGQIALGVATSAMIAGTSAANIAQISKTQMNGASNASSTPNTSAVSSVIAPVQYTQDVQGASIEGAIKDTKVYVTETDISDTQNKVAVTENEARY